jgi:hypothetical protein
MFLSVDAGSMTLANPTHIRSKGVMHRNPTFEGEVWQHPCHSLLALSSWPERMVNDYLVLRGP